MSYDENFLRQAIQIGESGLGRTFPNPIVGAVLVDSEGRVLGEGFHAGAEHAEVIAIADARGKGNEIRGATLYCSLEPCNHHGRTPPCTDAIIDAGIAEVYFALSDPNPTAAGGAERLRNAALEVKGDLLRDEAIYSNRAWITKLTLSRPRITLKIAQTLDARVAASNGESKWITSTESRTHAKKLRDGFDAICIGTGTAISDNPTLRGVSHNPVRYVLGERALPELLLDGEEGFQQLKTHLIEESLAQFCERGFNSVLIEGGPTIASAFLRAGVVDELHLYLAPSIMGSGRAAIDIPEFSDFSQQLHYGLNSLSIIDGDIFATYLKKESD